VTTGDGTVERAVRSTRDRWIRLAASAVASAAALVLVAVFTMFERGVFVSGGSVSWIATVLDSDLWGAVGATFLGTWVLVTCGVILFRAIVRPAKDDGVSDPIVPAMYFGLLVATVVAAVIIIVWIAQMTSVMG